MNYQRIIPRDLFNEGKLLTELGFLSVAIHDNKDGIANILSIELDDDNDVGFNIQQNKNNGSLFVENLICQHIDSFSEPIRLFIYLNNRSKNSLRFSWDTFEGAVFCEREYSKEFKALLTLLNNEDY